MLKHGVLVLAQLACLSGVLTGSLGLGRLVLTRCKLTGLTPGAEGALGTGLGLALLSYVVFALAALHGLSPLSLGLVSGAWIAGTACLWFLPSLNLRASEREVWASPWAKALVLILGTQLFLNLISALTPVWDWDGVAYHLALPKIYLAAGGLVFRPDIYHNLFPQLTEMLYLPGLLFPWGTAPKLVHFAFGLLASASVYALGREAKWRFLALLAAAVFYVQYLVHLESGTAFIDLATTAYVGLAALAFYQAIKSEAKPGWLYLTAFFLGLAAATKWHGLILLVLGLSLLWIKIQKQNAVPVGKKWQQALLAAGFGALPVIPYLLRAWLASGNPIWPLGYSLFHGAYWDAGMDKSMGILVSNFAGFSHGPNAWLRLPYDLIVHGASFGIGGAELRWPLAGLGLLFLANLVFFRLPESPTPAAPALPRFWIWAGAGAGLLYLAIWFASSPQMRFLLPLWGLIALGAVAGLRRLWLKPGALPRAAAVAAGLLLFAVHPPIHGDTILQMKTAAGLVSPEIFLAKKLDHYPACQYLNGHVPRGERVLLFQENRGFYLNVDYLWGDPKNQMLIDYRRLTTVPALSERLKELSVGWVLFRNQTIYTEGYYDLPVIQRMKDFLAARATPVFTSPAATVYQINK